VLQDIPWFADFLVQWANTWGDLLDTPESFNDTILQTFMTDAPRFRVEDSMIGDPPRSNSPSGWLTFNQFFARELNPGLRPISDPGNNTTVVVPADCTFNAHYEIDDSGAINPPITIKGTHTYATVQQLLHGSEYAEIAADHSTFPNEIRKRLRHANVYCLNPPRYSSACADGRTDGGDAQEVELLGGLGSRGRRVGDDAQVGAGDAENVAVELDVTNGIAANHLPFRLMLAHGPAHPQLPKPLARGQQLLDQGRDPAITRVSALNPAEVGHERRLEGVDTAGPADDAPLGVAQARPGEVCPQEVRSTRAGSYGFAEQSRPERAPGEKVPRGSEHGQGDLPEAGYQALHTGRDVRGHFAGQRWEEPGHHEEVIPLGVAQLEGPSERGRDLLGRSPGASLLQAHEVLDTQTGKRGEFLASQARRPPRITGEKPHVHGREAVAPRAQERSKVTVRILHGAILAATTGSRVVLPVPPLTWATTTRRRRSRLDA
jgi:phosphatidylserine decarboxylase